MYQDDIMTAQVDGKDLWSPQCRRLQPRQTLESTDHECQVIMKTHAVWMIKYFKDSGDL